MAANLGEASTKELLEELKARLEMVEFENVHVFRVRVDNVLEYLPAEVLEYRTVDS